MPVSAVLDTLPVQVAGASGMTRVADADDAVVGPRDDLEAAGAHPVAVRDGADSLGAGHDTHNDYILNHSHMGQAHHNIPGHLDTDTVHWP